MTDPVPSTESPPRRSKRRQLIVLICLVGIPSALSGLDPLAGWLLATAPRHLLFPSGSQVRHESGEFDVQVKISSQGLRDREFPPLPLFIVKRDPDSLQLRFKPSNRAYLYPSMDGTSVILS